MKTIGIIGGLGPETTSKFYLEIVFLCQQTDTSNRPEILISSVPLSYVHEKQAITRGFGEERIVPLLLKAAIQLEKAGSDFIVMPCNSLHVYIDKIRKVVSIPVLSVVEETTNFLVRNNIKSVGLLSTALTIKNKLYEQALREHGISQILPSRYQQIKIGRLIHSIVTNRHDRKDRLGLIQIIDSFQKKNVDGVVLACTDLQLLVPHEYSSIVYDSMKILAEEAVARIVS